MTEALEKKKQQRFNVSKAEKIGLVVFSIAWILLLAPWSMTFDDANLLWLLTLMSTVGMVVFSLLFPAWFLDPPRPHNLEKVWNEIFGKHLVAYVGFYLTLGGQRWFQLQGWEPQALLLALLLSLVLWIAGLKIISIQDDMLEKYRDHDCAENQDGRTNMCGYKLSWGLKWKIFKWNAILSFVSITVALRWAFSPVVTRILTSKPPLPQP